MKRHYYYFKSRLQKY